MSQLSDKLALSGQIAGIESRNNMLIHEIDLIHHELYVLRNTIEEILKWRKELDQRIPDMISAAVITAVVAALRKPEEK